MASFETGFDDAIRAALNEQLKVIAQEEITSAQERIAKRLHEHVATTAMAISKFYEMHRMEDKIIITVRDGSKP